MGLNVEDELEDMDDALAKIRELQDLDSMQKAEVTQETFVKRLSYLLGLSYLL